jgi:outer membrane biosynthesis protein TonB
MTTKQTSPKAIPTTQEQPQPVKPVADSTKPAASEQQPPLPSKDAGKRTNHPQTPKPKGKEASDKKGSNSKESTAKSSNASHSGSGKSKYHKNQP